HRATRGRCVRPCRRRRPAPAAPPCRRRSRGAPATEIAEWRSLHLLDDRRELGGERRGGLASELHPTVRAAPYDVGERGERRILLGIVVAEVAAAALLAR